MEVALSELSPLTFLMFTAVSIFIMGILSFLSGGFVLLRRAAGRQVQALATQTTRLADKGVTDDLAGLVGNASSLLDSLNQILRTTAGIGFAFCLLGLALIAGACWLAIQIYPVWP